jgi:hypothetical protein
MDESYGPYEVGSYYEVSPKIVEDRLMGKHLSIPPDVRPGAVVLCAKSHRRINKVARLGGHFRDDPMLFVDCIRFAYVDPAFQDECVIACFDVEIGNHTMDQFPYFKKITSPLRVLALAAEGLVL